MMKLVCICCILSVVATAFTAGAVSSSGISRAEGRMLKARGFHLGSHGKGHGGETGLDDYAPVDPSPSSKAVKHAPIQHGTPLIPYIPRGRASPPNPPMSAGGFT